MIYYDIISLCWFILLKSFDSLENTDRQAIFLWDLVSGLLFDSFMFSSSLNACGC